MSIFTLVYRNIITKPLNSLMSVLLLVLGISIISLLLLISTHYNDQFKRDIRGIDLVIGAKGSPLQLILSSIYQMDAPTGNISLSEAEKIAGHMLVKEAIPLAFGDSYKAYRIVGTEHSYAENYSMKVSQGRLWQGPFEVTIGQHVAKRLKISLGDSLLSSHGLDSNGKAHGKNYYRVVGIFEHSKSILDKLILCSIESVWNIHEDHGDEENHEGHDHAVGEEHHEDEKEITAMLIKFKNPYGMFQIPQLVNEESNMQAALPAIEVNRLFALLGLGLDGLRALAFLIILISAISIFISLYNSIKEKKYELALLRTLGASRFKLLEITIFEAMLLVLISFSISTWLSRFAFANLLNKVEGLSLYSVTSFAFLQSETYLFLAMLSVAILAALIPSIQAFKLNISRTLSES